MPASRACPAPLGKARPQRAGRRASASGSGAPSAARPGGPLGSSFDHVGRRAVPLRLEADPGLRAPPGHGGDGLPELRPTAAPACPPDHPPADRRRPPLRHLRHWPRPGIPRPERPPLPPPSSTWPTTYGDRPRPRGLPRPDRLARRARTGSAPSSPPARCWVEADPNLPGTHRPEGIIALCAPGVLPRQEPPGQSPATSTPTILSLFDLPIPSHVEGKPHHPKPSAALPPPPRGSIDRRRPKPIRGPHHRPRVRIHPRRAGDHRAEARGPGLSGMMARAGHEGKICRGLC